jgi:hypothetical protein
MDYSKNIHLDMNRTIRLKILFITFGSVFALLILPKLALAATLYLSPASGSFGAGSTFNVSVQTNTEGAAVNTAEARISYDTNTLELVSVRQGSTFALISPGSPSKGPGTAYFGGGLPTPGYTGGAGILGVMTFRAKAEGSATVSIDAGQVLLNDGLGTNAFSGSSGARFTITAPAVAAITVSSDTHPDPASWYSKSDVSLSWNRPAGAFGYSFDLDQKPDTIPDNTLKTTVTTYKSYPGLKDGIWYFHIKARGANPASGFGVTTHFKIQIDTQKPLAFGIKLGTGVDPQNVNLPATISFEATDETSGIDHYEIFAAGKLISDKASSPFTLDNLNSGSQKIRVVAFDKAGNQQFAEIEIAVQAKGGGFFQRSLTLPIYVILLINVWELILIIILLWLVLRKRSKRHDSGDEMDKLRTEVDKVLEELKLDISRRLVALTAHSFNELLKKEGKEAAVMSKKMIAAKKKLESKLKNNESEVR